MLISLIKERVAAALQKAYGEAIEPEVVQSTQEKFGHYQCNNALKLAKVLKKSPRLVAQEILAHFDGSQLIQKAEVVDPGFINFFLDPHFLAKQVEKAVQDPRLSIPLPQHPLRVIVEFSSPNIAKELHVGHLRSTIIGDALARLLEFLGHDVLRLNHIGDWGTQFGMLIAYLKLHQPDVLTGKKEADLPTLMNWYRASKQLFDADPAFKKSAQLEVVRLQGGDEAALEAWEMICDISRRAFKEIYDLLDVKLVERGESFYNPYLPAVVADLEKKGLITLSDGAKCVFLEGFTTREGTPLPMIVQKSDGGYNYDTTDMAAMRHRIEQEGAERIVIVTDAGQSLHFQMIEKVSELAGYLNPAAVQFNHVPFGVVLGADGKKFKTRSGEVEKLIDLITEAVSRAQAIFTERLPDATPQEIEELGTILGVDALKYADLCCHRLKDYTFSYERMLKFEGNTAAFLLYAYVRIEGIKRKANKNINLTASITLDDPAEIALALHILRFGDTLDCMARELLPNRLCEYLYDLAEKFHAFFRDCHVVGSPQEESRLLLCEATARTLKQGLEILGLKTLPRM